MKYRIYQISIKDLRDDVNELGWDGGAKKHPRVHAYLQMTFGGSANFESSFVEFYSHVADIDADDLEHVFEIGNLGVPYSRIRKVGAMRSISVGDLIIDENDDASIVNGEGFGVVVAWPGARS